MKSTKRTDWTSPKNVKLVLSEVKASPTNLSAAFKRVSEKLNVSIQCVTQAWYTTIRKKTVGFETKSDNVTHNNIKNIRRKKVENGNLIFEQVISTKTYDGLQVVTIKKYLTV